MKNHFPIFPIGAILKIANASRRTSSTLKRDEKRASFKFFMRHPDSDESQEIQINLYLWKKIGFAGKQE
jgi:hypothetical protein